jgi:hypothetical protein
MALRLEEILGALPPDWPTLSIGELAAHPRPANRRFGARLDTSVVLRAVAITLVVATHAGLAEIKGGAHLLLAVAGFNFARFQLAAAGGRSVRLGRSIAAVALPSVAWIAALVLTTDGDHGWTNLALVHNHTGPAHHDERWHYWFVEVLVQLLVVLAIVFAIPAVRRLEDRHRFGFPFLLATAGVVAVRLDTLGLAGIADRLYRPQTLFWLFALGWAAARARTAAQRWAVTALALVALWGFFDSTSREAIVATGVMLLTWCPSLTVPRWLATPLSTVAGASLFVYLTHWEIYPWVGEHATPVVAVMASLAVGIAVARVEMVPWTRTMIRT